MNINSKELLPFLCNRIPRKGLELIFDLVLMIFCSNLGKLAICSSLKRVLELLLVFRIVKILLSFG